MTPDRVLSPMRIVDRYLLRLMVLPVLIGLSVFVVILMSEAAIDLGQALVGSTVPASLIAQYLLYSLPRAISWSLPVGVLVGVAMVSTAITRNGEATAVRAGGTSLRRLWVPFIVVGFLGSVASFCIEEYIVPSANQRSTRAFLQMTNSQPVLRPRNDQAFRDKDGRIFYVGHMDEKTNRLNDVLVMSNAEDGQLRTLTAAKWAELRGKSWVLCEGVVLSFAPDGAPVGKPQRFATQEVSLWAALQDYYLDQRSEFEMSARELEQASVVLETGGIDAQRLKVRMQFKYSIPLACLVFVLVAAPLGMRYAHLGSFVGIVLSILIVFLYNGVRSWGLAFGLVGDLPPVIAAWAQNVIFGGWGLYLVFRSR
jgi:lipopolysaccharide export system permease protein